MNIWSVISENPFFATVCFLSVMVVLAGVVELASRAVVRCTRSFNIATRGWPPAHLDADGDWKPEPEPEKDNDPE